MSAPALRVVSVVDAVADGLRSAILSGEITPGTPLAEAALSRRFDVPRPTVRSALLLVMQDGLLRREPNRSVYVPVLTRDDVTDLFAVRRMTELDAVERLVAQRAHPAAALRALRILEALDDSDGWDEFVRYDFELHQGLIDAVGSPRLSRIYQGISAETHLALTQLRSVYPSPADIAVEHRVLLDAIGSHDRDRALAAVRDHLDESEQIILDLLDTNQGEPHP